MYSSLELNEHFIGYSREDLVWSLNKNLEPLKESRKLIDLINTRLLSKCNEKPIFRQADIDKISFRGPITVQLKDTNGVTSPEIDTSIFKEQQMKNTVFIETLQSLNIPNDKILELLDSLQNPSKENLLDRLDLAVLLAKDIHTKAKELTSKDELIESIKRTESEVSEKDIAFIETEDIMKKANNFVNTNFISEDKKTQVMHLYVDVFNNQHHQLTR